MTCQQVADFLGISLSTVLNYIHQGLVHPQKVRCWRGKRWEFTPQQVEQVRQVYIERIQDVWHVTDEKKYKLGRK